MSSEPREVKRIKVEDPTSSRLSSPAVGGEPGKCDFWNSPSLTVLEGFPDVSWREGERTMKKRFCAGGGKESVGDG